MSVFRAKLWTGLGAAALLSAGGLAACSGEGGEGGGTGAAAPSSSAPAGAEGEGGEGGQAAPVSPAGGEGEGGEAGAAAAGGERGAQGAYAAVPADSRRALRLAQLTGLFQAAKAVGAAEGAEAAAALAGQGLLEVYHPAKAELTGVDEAVLRRAAQSGEPAALNAAVASLEAAAKQAGGDPGAVARGLSALTVGLYRETTAGGAIDPVEYQHSYAAALALQSLAGRQGALSGAKADIDRLVRLWPGPVAPEQGAPTLAQVQAQASRVELALSGV